MLAPSDGLDQVERLAAAATDSLEVRHPLELALELELVTDLASTHAAGRVVGTLTLIPQRGFWN